MEWKYKSSERGVREPPSYPRGARQTIDEEARRADRAKLRALLRHRRHAADAPAQTRQYSQTAADPRGRVQSVAGHAPDNGSGHRERPAGPRCAGSARAHGASKLVTGAESDPDRIQCGAVAFGCPQLGCGMIVADVSSATGC